MAKGMSDKQIKHFMVREGDYGSAGYEPPGEPGALSRGAGPSPEAASQAVNYKGSEIRVYRNAHKSFDVYINGKPRLSRNSPLEAIQSAKQIIDSGSTAGTSIAQPPVARPGESRIGEKAVSQKQRAFLNAKFGHAWVKRHHFGQEGELPEYAHGGKTTSPEVKAAFNKKKKKEKTEETTTTVNIGPGPSTVPSRPRPKLQSRPKPASPVLQKKKKEPLPARHAVRSYTGREMKDARNRVMQMVSEYETDRDRQRGVRPNKNLTEGATDFFVVGTGANAQEAFTKLVQQALHQHGHGGYSGSIAEKTKFTMIGQAADIKAAQTQARQLMDSDDRRISDKWGPAGCIAIPSKKQYVFFGWAST